jgi:hypothetical protein
MSPILSAVAIFIISKVVTSIVVVSFPFHTIHDQD